MSYDELEARLKEIVTDIDVALIEEIRLREKGDPTWPGHYLQVSRMVGDFGVSVNVSLLVNYGGQWLRG